MIFPPHTSGRDVFTDIFTDIFTVNSTELSAGARQVRSKTSDILDGYFVFSN